MNADEIMALALDIAALREIPADSAIFRRAENVRRILLGIDIREDDLRRAKVEGYGLVIAHHPLDRAGFIGVLGRHEMLMLRAGVPPERAREACRRHKAWHESRAAARPHDDTPRRMTALAAELGLGLMNIHTPCDEAGRMRLQAQADALGGAASVSALMDAYRAIPEIAASGEGVELVCGSPASPIGKTVVIHGAGTNGGYPVANALFESGTDTVVYIHLAPLEQRAQLETESKGNLILTGHYGSDSLGINPLVDALEAAGIEVSCCNRMVRIRRTGPADGA